MARARTAPPPRVTELQKARVRLPVLVVLALLGPPLAGMHTIAVWVVYILFVGLYSLWALRLARVFASDRRLGYFLCLTDAAILLPLLAWGSAAGMRAFLICMCVAGVAVTYWADKTRMQAAARTAGGARALSLRPEPVRAQELDGETGLERAVGARFRIFTATGARFALVVLRVLRFEEAASYYGNDASKRLLSAVSRRGLRFLGPDAQHFALQGGRVAFLFETEPESGGFGDRHGDGFTWSAPYDVEGLAMTLGRKVCEHLVDGHRVECVVGWASAPADGMSAEDLMYVAESGAQSTAAFRRVTAPELPASQGARAAAG